MELCAKQLEDGLQKLEALRHEETRLLEELRQAELGGEFRECCTRREKWFVARQRARMLNQYIEQFIQFRLPAARACRAYGPSPTS
jgi:hypothetical protein